MKKNLIINDKMDMELLLNVMERPELYSADIVPFWDDPHISLQMLEAHLNPSLDAASYNHKKIVQIADWLVKYLNLQENARILDLGCGPGLYSTRFSQHGLNVVGMDYSKNSINYAKMSAEKKSLNIEYIYQDYLTMDYTSEFDAIVLIYCDFGALTDCKRDLLLKKIYKALKPDGIFVFDVFTRSNWEQQTKRNWYVSEAGFWRPSPHIVLEQTFHYETENVYLNQYSIIERSGEVSIYNLYDHYYSKESIIHLMEESGYQVQEIWSTLTGKAYMENTKCLGVVAKK